MKQAPTDPSHPATKLNALVALGSGASALDKPVEGTRHTATFETAKVRGYFHKGEWWLSIIDVIAALAVSSRPSKYWTDLRTKLAEEEGFSDISGFIGNLKMPTADGKLRGAETVTVRTLLRIVQSVPSPKVEPLKQWLAEVGYERMQEVEDPSKALERRSTSTSTRVAPRNGFVSASTES